MVLGKVGASHLVTADPLDPVPEGLRWGPAPEDFWRQTSAPEDYAKLPSLHLADAEHPLPLVSLPLSLTRTKARVGFELANNSAAEGVVVLVTLPRATFDVLTDGNSLAQAAPSLFSGWGDNIRVSKAVCFADPPLLSVLPFGNTQLPPATWDTVPLNVSLVLVALLVTRSSGADGDVTFMREGSHPSLKQL